MEPSSKKRRTLEDETLYFDVGNLVDINNLNEYMVVDEEADKQEKVFQKVKKDIISRSIKVRVIDFQIEMTLDSMTVMVESLVGNIFRGEQLYQRLNDRIFYKEIHYTTVVAFKQQSNASLIGSTKVALVWLRNPDLINRAQDIFVLQTKDAATPPITNLDSAFLNTGLKNAVTVLRDSYLTTLVHNSGISIPQNTAYISGESEVIDDERRVFFQISETEDSNHKRPLYWMDRGRNFPLGTEYDPQSGIITTGELAFLVIAGPTPTLIEQVTITGRLSFY